MQAYTDAIERALGAIVARAHGELALVRDRSDAIVAQAQARVAEAEARILAIDDQIASRLAAVRDGKDGIDGAEGRAGEPGQAGAPGPRGEKGEVGERGETGPQGDPGPAGADGRDGKDATREMVLDAIRSDPGLIREAVAAHIKENPPQAGADGRDGRDGADGAPGRDGINGEKGEPGRDGTGIAAIMIDPDGQLFVTLTDGETKELGPVVGRNGADGIPGRDGKDGAAGEVGAPGPIGPAGKLPLVRAWRDTVHYEGDVVHHAGACWQAVRDTGRAPPADDWQIIASAGQAGADGRDGVDGRSFVHRGTWAADAAYTDMDVVVLGGSAFVAMKDDPGVCPGAGWQLLAGRGSKGPAGERGATGPKGDPGAPVIRASVDDAGMLGLVNGDGTIVECDLYPLLSRLG